MEATVHRCFDSPGRDSDFSPSCQSSSKHQSFVSPVGSKRSKTYYENRDQEMDYKNLVHQESPEILVPRKLFGESPYTQTPKTQRTQNGHSSGCRNRKNNNILFDLQLEKFQLSSSSSHKAIADEIRQEILARKTGSNSTPLTQEERASILNPLWVSNTNQPRASTNTTTSVGFSIPGFYSVQKPNSDQKPPAFSKRLFQECSEDEEDGQASSTIEPCTPPCETITQRDRKHLLFAQKIEIGEFKELPVDTKKKQKQTTIPSPLFSLLKETVRRPFNTTVMRSPLATPGDPGNKKNSHHTIKRPSVQSFSPFHISSKEEVGPQHQACNSRNQRTNQLALKQHNFQLPFIPDFSLVELQTPIIPNSLNQSISLIKGKSEMPSLITEEYSGLFDQLNHSPSQGQEKHSSWNLDLNRRNSEVCLDTFSGVRRGDSSLDFGENEFAKVMTVQDENCDRNGRRSSIAPANKKRAQTLLCQIPESTMMRMYDGQKCPQVNPFEVTEEESGPKCEMQQLHHLRSQIIEQQDFNVLLKKASSQFLFNNRPVIDGSFGSPQKSCSSSQEASGSGSGINQRFVNDFTDIKVIKASSNATVYKSKVNGLVYAVKALAIPREATQSAGIMKEVRSLAKFSSYGFGLLRLYNVWAEDGILYLVTEHCLENLRGFRNGGSRQKPSESMVRQVIHDVCESLQFLHEKECAHLGIKPENILLSKKLKFKLADLGISKIQQVTTDQESHYPYIAPELVGGNAAHARLAASTKADIFSLGAVLYELMTDNDLPKNGVEWEGLRCGRLTKLMNSVRNPHLRPTAGDILSLCASDDVHEQELKFLQQENHILEKKVEDLTKKLEQTNSRYQYVQTSAVAPVTQCRKNSF